MLHNRRGAWRSLPGTPLVRRSVRALRRYGLRGAAIHGWTAFRELPATRRTAKQARAFDVATGVETAGVVRLEALSIESENATLGHRYQASEAGSLRRTLASLPVEYEQFVFVDIGSGKGRALLVAAEFPFKQIIGVEFAPELNEVARQNLAAYSGERRCAWIEVITADAADYSIPDDPVILYFYNPFLEPVMSRVMDRVSASLGTQPRPAFIVLTSGTPFQTILKRAGFTRVNDLPDDVADEVYAGPVMAPAR